MYFPFVIGNDYASISGFSHKGRISEIKKQMSSLTVSPVCSSLPHTWPFPLPADQPKFRSQLEGREGYCSG
jgi:hypothetical protein